MSSSVQFTFSDYDNTQRTIKQEILNLTSRKRIPITVPNRYPWAGRTITVESPSNWLHSILLFIKTLSWVNPYESNKNVLLKNMEDTLEQLVQAANNMVQMKTSRLQSIKSPCTAIQLSEIDQETSSSSENNSSTITPDCHLSFYSISNNANDENTFALIRKLSSSIKTIWQEVMPHKQDQHKKSIQNTIDKLVSEYDTFLASLIDQYGPSWQEVELGKQRLGSDMPQFLKVSEDYLALISTPNEDEAI